MRLLTLWPGLLGHTPHAPTHAAGKELAVGSAHPVRLAQQNLATINPSLDPTRRLLKHDTPSARRVVQ